jgi:CheY-like chemotaxis protein
MSKTGPIILIEDDEDDKNIFMSVVRGLGYKNLIIWHENADEAFNYLCTTTDSPFVIFSDVNLPGINGLDFKKKIDDVPELRRKSIPYIFYSTSANQHDVNVAYTQMTIQGFFKKDGDYDVMKKHISLILEYWSVCRHPNLGVL